MVRVKFVLPTIHTSIKFRSLWTYHSYLKNPFPAMPVDGFSLTGLYWKKPRKGLLPGAIPPTSAWCPLLATKKTGFG